MATAGWAARIETAGLAALLAAGNASAGVAETTVSGTFPTFLEVPGGHTGAAYAVNADGTVAVGEYGDTNATLWKDGTLTELGFLYGENGTTSFARGVSADGTVVVGQAGVNNDLQHHAFVWTEADGMLDLGTLGDSTLNSIAYGISGNGRIIVGASEAPGGGTDPHAVIWTGGHIQDLGNLGYAWAEAEAADYDGSVVVGYSVTTNAIHAFRWSNGLMTDLGTLEGSDPSLGGDFSIATAVNSNGAVIAGASSFGGDANARHAVIWTNGQIQDLGALGTSSYSYAYGISGNGAIVVGDYTSDNSGNEDAAFRWTQATGMKDLRDLLVGAGVNMDNTNLYSAYAISANGQFIVGYGGTIGMSYVGPYIVRYVDDAAGLPMPDGTGPIAGMTTLQSAQQSVDGLAATRQTMTTQMQGFANQIFQEEAALGPHDLQSGFLWRTSNQSTTDSPFAEQSTEVGGFGAVGSASFGITARRSFGSLTLSGGLGVASEDYDGGSMNNALLLGGKLGYVAPLTPNLGWQAEAGGLLSPTGTYTFNRTYQNGSGTATGTGTTDGEMSYVFGRVGVLYKASDVDFVAPSFELGYQQFHTDAYVEPLLATNPFEASVAATDSSTAIVKLGGKWTHQITGDLDLTVTGALAHAFSSGSTLSATIDGIGTLTPIASSGGDNWVEYGAGLSYRLSNQVSASLAINGISGSGIGTKVHVGGGVHMAF